jgi:hypothetical protein
MEIKNMSHGKDFVASAPWDIIHAANMVSGNSAGISLGNDYYIGLVKGSTTAWTLIIINASSESLHTIVQSNRVAATTTDGANRYNDTIAAGATATFNATATYANGANWTGIVFCSTNDHIFEFFINCGGTVGSAACVVAGRQIG